MTLDKSNRVTRGANLRSKDQRSRLLGIKVDRFTSNQNKQRPILHVSSNTFNYQRKCFVFCVICLCVYLFVRLSIHLSSTLDFLQTAN